MKASLSAGLLFLALSACSGNKSESNADEAQMGADTVPVMGNQGDTTINRAENLNSPVAAPGDTATGQTLPEARVKKKEGGGR